MDDTELSKRSGIHISLVRRYLSGEVDIGIKNAPKIAEALDIPLTSVLYGQPRKNAANG